MPEQPPPQSTPHRSRLWHLGVAFAILFVTLLVFSQVREFEFVGYDDPMYIGTNPEAAIIRDGLSWEGLRWIWTATVASLWEPLTYLSHMLDVELFGLGEGAGGKHHLANLFLHAANAGLVYLLGASLFRSSSVAAMGAFLFALHPMRAESVGWVSERKGVLCAFFVFLALISYVRFARREYTNERFGARFRWLLASVVFTVLAMMSKPAAFVIPLLIGLIDIVPLGRCGFELKKWRFTTILVRQLKEKYWFVLAAIALTVVSVGIQYFGAQQAKFIGANSFGERVTLIPTVLSFYVQRTLLPIRLNVDYPQPLDGAFFRHLSSFILVIAMTVYAIMNCQRRPGIFFAWGWFLASLFPVCGLVYVGSSFTTDRYTYIAHAGLFLGLAWEVSLWLQSRDTGGEGDKGANGDKVLAKAALAGGVALTLVFGWLTLQQLPVWKDNFALFGHSIEAQERVDMGYTNLAVAHERSGEPKKALALLEELYSKREGAVGYITLFNMGRLNGLLSGDPANGIDPRKQVGFYQAALKLNPNHAPSLHNGGKLVLTHVRSPGEMDLAYRMLSQASAYTKHENPLYLNTLAKCCMMRAQLKDSAIRERDIAEARQRVEQALALKISTEGLRSALLEKRRQIDLLEKALGEG